MKREHEHLVACDGVRGIRRAKIRDSPLLVIEKNPPAAEQLGERSLKDGGELDGRIRLLNQRVGPLEDRFQSRARRRP
jgi:hypothetical protein